MFILFFFVLVSHYYFVLLGLLDCSQSRERLETRAQSGVRRKSGHVAERVVWVEEHLSGLLYETDA